jgi:hypothetical protein
VLLCACAMFVICFNRCCWVLYLQGVERGISVKMLEAYPAAELPMCGGEPLCW